MAYLLYEWNLFMSALTSFFRKTQVLSFDLETTGVVVGKDRVVEIGLVYFEEGKKKQVFATRVNPKCPIPPVSTSIHGIRDADVEKKPTFEEIAPRLIEHLTGAILGGEKPFLLGYNACTFDAPLLNNEFQRIGSSFRINPAEVLDPIVFVRWYLRTLKKHSLGAVCDHFNITLENAHSALGDACAAGELFFKLVANGHVPHDPKEALQQQARFYELVQEERSQFSYWLYRDRQTEVMKIGAGKFQGSTLEELSIDYLQKLVGNISDLPPKVKEIFRQQLEKKLSLV